jgi:hypothetical protein
MSIVTSFSVFCDGEEEVPDERAAGTFKINACLNWIAETTEGIGAARRWAKREGWVHRKGKDFCPTCKDIM